MNRKQWLKEFKNCKHKTVDASRRTHGNLLCGLSWPISHRCMFKKCPLISHAAAGKPVGARRGPTVKSLSPKNGLP